MGEWIIACEGAAVSQLSPLQLVGPSPMPLKLLPNNPISQTTSSNTVWCVIVVHGSPDSKGPQNRAKLEPLGSP